MNTRFTLPVAFAIAVHATLLFGFRHAVVSPTTKLAVKEPLPPVISIEDWDKPKPVEKEQTVAKGSPDPEKPSLPDEPRALKPLDIPIDVSPDVPHLVRVDYKFPNDLPGQIDGIDGGVKPSGISVISSGLLDNPPNARVQAPPDYPFTARKEGRTGEVLVEFVVDETGRVSDPVVVRSTDRVFEEPSLRAVLKWRFEPGKRDGRVVRFRMAVPMVFNFGDL